MRRVAALGAVRREAIRRERERRRRARLAAAISLNASRGSPLYMDSLKNVTFVMKSCLSAGHARASEGERGRWRRGRARD